MLRVVFTLEDFVRLRMTPGLGPVAESVFALDAFGRRGGPALEGWRRRTGARLGDRLAEVHQLIRDGRPVPDLLWLLERRRDASPSKQLNTVLAFCRVAVLPHWSRLHGQLETDRETRGRLAISGGVEAVLGALHPRVRWNAPALELPDEPDGEIRLDGKGLLLCPSAFLSGTGPVVLRAEKESGMPVIAFPAQVDLAALTDPGGESEPNEQVLGALVGATRAAALFALTESCTTGALSQRLGISLAGASKHATVLRKAGLVTTTRNRNTALHTLTSLGVALMQNGAVAGALGSRQSVPV
ncbi:ArsR/SmtB family transcription factor [Amycolatopsis sp. CA-230715]|uniref:ArsR/SmtB family transcription factor n=1 Tax=Amycolatopsis sp. CA-230715 TaxID=2745196 RepID=UPI001C02B356|nr:winged helix-turn-helix domain-containing protein [Amycolatopsis sp. CA-230715]QWF85960.1 hypothetical protein HUW46_09441 [Amycolatopsis sp. CA-230715]